MRIESTRTTGLIIDIQEKLFPVMHDKENLRIQNEKLIKGLQELSINIEVTQQYPKGLGPIITPLREMIQDFTPYDKISFSCCDDPDFFNQLESTEKKNILVAGIETHVCILQTTLDLLEKGYQPVIIEDCVSSRHLPDKEIAIARMRQEGAIISSLESILFELCRYAGTEEFKAISRLIK